MHRRGRAIYLDEHGNDLPPGIESFVIRIVEGMSGRAVAGQRNGYRPTPSDYDPMGHYNPFHGRSLFPFHPDRRTVITA